MNCKNVLIKTFHDSGGAREGQARAPCTLAQADMN